MDGRESGLPAPIAVGAYMRLKGRAINRANTETGANTPCLKHFFRCLETSGSTWSDSQGGIVWPGPAEGFTFANGWVMPMGTDNEAPTMLTRGSWHSFTATESALIIYAGRLSAAAAPRTRFALGDINSMLAGTNGAGFGLSDGSFHTALGINGVSVPRITMGAPLQNSTAVIYGGTTYTSVPALLIPAPVNGVQAVGTPTMSGGTSGSVTGATLSNFGTNYPTDSSTLGQCSGGGASGTQVEVIFSANPSGPTVLGTTFDGDDVIVAARYTPGSILKYSAWQLGTGTLLLDATAQSSTTLNAGAFQPFGCMRTSGVGFYGAAVFAFQNGLPADIYSAIMYLGAQWKAGNRLSYPGWIGLT